VALGQTQPLSPQTTQLIAYGLLMGGAAVVGKLMIDGLVGDMDAAKARREFIGPIYQAPTEPKNIHVKLSDVVRFLAMGVSIYSILADLPTLVSEWGSVEAQLQEIVK
jgi:hypothetical protein